MLTKEQIELADRIIKKIKTIDDSNRSSYINDFKKEGVDYIKLKELIEILIKLDIVFRIPKTETFICLTPKGNKASEIGVEKYLRLIEKQNRKLKLPIIISIIAIFISSIEPLLNLKETVFPKSETEERNTESYYRQKQTDSITTQLLSDSIFIEKTKNLIKYDTLFLNELKEEIIQEIKITNP